LATLPPVSVGEVIKDADRLAALRRLMLLDRASTPTFDRLTTLAAHVLDAPIALLTLVDEDRQFFLSAWGLPEPLASAPRVLVHGDLVCANAVRVARGVVLLGWRHAALGPGALDVARLARDLERAGQKADAKAVRDLYVSESGVPNALELMVRAGQTVAAAKAVEESPDSTGHRSG